jgi:hypothetical protein
MKFGEALEFCRQGKRIYRTGWNGKDQFVFYQEGGIATVQYLQCDAIRKWAQKELFLSIEIMGHFDIKTTAGAIQCGWTASQGDMQAEDWEVFE